MPRIANLPLPPEHLASLSFHARREFTRTFRFACRTVATLDGAPPECRNKACRETGACHLDYRHEWQLFCPGAQLDFEGRGTALLVILADFAGEMMRGANEKTMPASRSTPQITLSSRKARPSATRS